MSDVNDYYLDNFDYYYFYAAYHSTPEHNDNDEHNDNCADLRPEQH